MQGATRRGLLTGLTLAWIAVPLAVSLPFGVNAQPAADPLWDALRAPGAVVVLRHSFAPGGFDPPDAKLDDCSTQRNLDESGRSQARKVGEAFRQQGIAVGAVLSSPRCRCLDTARLAFGRVEKWSALLGSLNDAELRRRQVEDIKNAIAEQRDGPPLVLVTHGSVVSDLTGLNVRMGEFVVLRRAADGAREVAGRLYVD
ncbi:MAG: histidine phosphatase family protein [Candidatus Rokuibacteriota bacterium]|nr:MAG: histidine phosphatase family protein [Candidatus Rokubacteria bacterium]